MSNPLFIVENLDAGYKTRHGSTVVVKGVDATLHKGEVVALIGRNGAGKSTLLRTFAAFQPPLGGRVMIAGCDVAKMQAADVAKSISIVLSNSETAPLTVQEVVSLGRTPYINFLGKLAVKDKKAVEMAMEMMGITRFANRMLATLSDGERQKCMIAKALAQETPLMLLDEPTAFLDYPSKVSLFKLLKQLAVTTGKAVLVSTHDIELSFALTNRVWFVDGGVMHKGTAEELLDTDAVKSFVDCGDVHYNMTKQK